MTQPHYAVDAHGQMIVTLTVEQLAQLVRNEVREAMKEFRQEIHDPEPFGDELTSDQVCNYLDISHVTLRKLVKQRLLNPSKRGRTHKYKMAEVKGLQGRRGSQSPQGLTSLLPDARSTSSQQASSFPSRQQSPQSRLRNHKAPITVNKQLCT